MKLQRWELDHDGHHHRVEVTGEVTRTVTWWVDDEQVAQKKSMDDKLRLTRDGGQALTVVYSALGAPRRATLYDDLPQALLNRGGDDLVPEEGSRAARWEQAVLEHPGRHALVATLGGVAKVVGPILAVAVLIPLLRLIPWPDLPSIPLPDLPSIPWPDLPSIPWPDLDLPDWRLPGWVRWLLDHSKYVVPIVIAFVLARGEIRRRREQQERRALRQGQRAARPASADEAQVDAAVDAEVDAEAASETDASAPVDDEGTPAPGTTRDR